jgi:hypothetical protein
VVIGVHAPEFAFERDVGNVTKAMKELGINYPVAIDNDYKIWRAFNNEYWPAHYFADAQGRIRYHHFGEGDYAESERVIQQLLREAGAKTVADGLINADAQGVQQAPDMNQVLSPETYVGYQRAEHFVPETGLVPDKVATYNPPANLTLNDWSLGGQWPSVPKLPPARRPAASSTASMPATCIWCWARARMANRCVSKSRLTVRRRVPPMVWMSPRMAAVA